MVPRIIRQQQGFTIIELLVCVSLLAILATVAYPLAQLERQRAKERLLTHALWEIRQALDAYHDAVQDGKIAAPRTHSGYPPHLNALLAAPVTDAQRVNPDLPWRFLRRIPRDPFHTDLDIPAHQTWGLRSYASSHSAPRAGEDVYDVYS